MFFAIAPNNNGTIDLTDSGNEEVIVVASSASALTWIMPSASGQLAGKAILVTNILAGVITLRNPGNTATIGTIHPGRILRFTLSGDGSWDGPRASDYGTETQITSLTTAVTLNRVSGSIETVPSDLAAGQTAIFQVNSNKIAANSMVVCAVTYEGNSGDPTAQIRSINPAGGSFRVLIKNQHASQQLNDTITVLFDSWPIL